MHSPSDTNEGPSALRFLATLEEVGVLDLLRKTPDGLSADELAFQLSLEKKLLEPVCDFATLNSSIIERKHDKYILNQIPKRLQNRIAFLLAYEPVFSNLARLLKKEFTYGKDISRNGKYLQNSSALYNEAAWQTVLEFVNKKNYKFIIDLGCGSGEFLIEAAKKLPHIKAIGIDIDGETVQVAQTHATISGLTDRVSIIKGDARKPEFTLQAYKKETGPSEICFVGITLWHEFLTDDETFLCDLLQKYGQLFPGSGFVAVEYDGLSYDELARLPQPDRTYASIYQLVHPLTNQGMPKPRVFWQALFKKAGIELFETLSCAKNLTVLTGIFPK